MTDQVDPLPDPIFELIDACIGSVACDGSTAGACASTLKAQVAQLLAARSADTRTRPELEALRDELWADAVSEGRDPEGSLSRARQYQDLADHIDAFLSGKAHTQQERLVEMRVLGHGEGQEHTIADVNAGHIDDLIAPRLQPLKDQLQQAEAHVEDLTRRLSEKDDLIRDLMAVWTAREQAYQAAIADLRTTRDKETP